jgi:hypothetical protein
VTALAAPSCECPHPVVEDDAGQRGCAKCGRELRPTEPPSIAEVLELFAARYHELLVGHEGGEVMDLPAAQRLGPDGRLVVEAHARRVAGLVRASIDERPPLKRVGNSVADVARCLGMSEKWVYRHKDELGAVKRGSKRQSRLEFTREAIEAFEARRS